AHPPGEERGRALPGLLRRARIGGARPRHAIRWAALQVRLALAVDEQAVQGPPERLAAARDVGQQRQLPVGPAVALPPFEPLLGEGLPQLVEHARGVAVDLPSRPLEMLLPEPQPDL